MGYIIAGLLFTLPFFLFIDGKRKRAILIFALEVWVIVYALDIHLVDIYRALGSDSRESQVSESTDFVGDLTLKYGKRISPPVAVEEPPFFTHVWDNTAKYTCCDFNMLQFIPETYRHKYYVMVFTVFHNAGFSDISQGFGTQFAGTQQYTYLKRLREDIGDDIPIFLFRVNDVVKGFPIVNEPTNVARYVDQVAMNSNGAHGTGSSRYMYRALAWLSQFDVGITDDRLKDVSQQYGAFFPIVLLVNKDGKAIASWGNITGSRGISGRYLSKEILTLVHGKNEKTRKMVAALADKPYKVPMLSWKTPFNERMMAKTKEIAAYFEKESKKAANNPKDYIDSKLNAPYSVGEERY